MLQQTQRTRLLKQLSLLGSNFEGEQIAAINSINRTLESSKLTWNDFIQTLDSADLSGAYNSGFSDGFQAACDYKNSETLYPNRDKYYQMLVALKKRSDKLNEWSRAFVSNILENWFAKKNSKRLSPKQCACIERMYHQFCR